MKLPIKWLQDYVEIPTNVEQLMAKLTSIGHMQDGPAKEVGDDIIYELEIRQNRSDCLSIVGLAREAAAVLDVTLQNPTNNLQPLSVSNENVTINIEDPKLCYRFNEVTIDHISVKPSPEWLTRKIESYGIKSINNIVDITNFVMIELGQPLHAFDANKIDNHSLTIRQAKDKETLTVLGGKKMDLTHDDLVITDSNKIVAFAGIMGGEESGVNSETTSIILEAATYNQGSVRRSSIRHSLRTEASTRLEKFLHPHLTEIALQRAAHLITELAGGEISGHTDNYPNPKNAITINLSIDHLNLLGGTELSLHTAQSLLERLEIPTEKISENELKITVPYFRTDLEQEADIIEEVLRLYGYDNIPEHLPNNPPPTNLESIDLITEENLRDILVAGGFSEEITDPLTKEDQPSLEPLMLENSLNAHKTMLRTTLRFNLENAVSNYKKHRKTDISLFELGKIYYKEEKEYKEKKMLGVIHSSKQLSYAHMKGLIEFLSLRLGKSIHIDKSLIQQINNDPTFFFEIAVEDLISDQKDSTKVLTDPPQVILQDWSLFVPLTTDIGEMIEYIKHSSSLIFKIALGEEPQVKNDQKSVFLNLQFHNPDKMITNEDVEKEREKIISLISDSYKAIIR